MTQLLQNAAYGSVLILTVVFLRRVLKDKLVPGARLALWAVCLFRLLTPAAPESVLSLWALFSPLAPASRPFGPAYSTMSYLPPAAEAFVPQIAEPGMSPDLYLKPAPFPWERVLLAVWLIVGGALAVRFVLSYARTRRAVGRAALVGRDDPRYALLPKCARLREGAMDGAPLTFGAVRPTVVLTPGLAGEELVCVLAHEGVHARRRDNLWHYGMALALVVQWWNPAVWLMARLLRRDVELSCDRAAVKALGEDKRAEYANALVSMATMADGPAFCQTFGRKAAEERIISVMKYKKMTVIGAALTLALVLAVTVGFASNPGERASDAGGAPLPETWFMSFDADGNLTDMSIGLGLLEKDLAKHVADGSMTQEEAGGVLEQARALSKNGLELTWIVPAGSGLVADHDHVVNADDFPVFVFYKNENGGLVPVDLTAIVCGFILPAARGDIDNALAKYLDEMPHSEPDYVVYPGTPVEEVRAMYKELLNRLVTEGSRTQAETEAMLAELEEVMAQVDRGEADSLMFNPAADGEIVSVGPAAQGETPIGEPELDYDTRVEDSAGVGDEPIACPPEAIDANFPTELFVQSVSAGSSTPASVCPVEGCTVRGPHEHNGVTYACNGAHCGGVCDGSCNVYFGDGASAAPATNGQGNGYGYHSESHSTGHHGNHH